MSTSGSWRSRLITTLVSIGCVLTCGAIIVIAATQFPRIFGVARVSSSEHAAEECDHADHDRDPHAGHDHGDEGAAAESVQLTDQARANMRLRVAPVSVGVFTDYIDVPATIVDWPGRTHVDITSPLTGVINAIHVSRGEMIHSGAPLFELRLTHQDLVKTQQNFLTSLGQLDVENREITRLTSVASSGAIAGKTLLAREYERDKLMAEIQAAKQSLLLHGLTEKQVQRVEQSRKLISEVTIFAPVLHADRSLHHDSHHESSLNVANGVEARYASLAQPPPEIHPPHIDAEFLVTEMTVRRGGSVEAGQKLAQLSDYSQLLIEGAAFQRDGEALRKAADSEPDLQAVIESAAGEPEVIKDLRIVYIGNEVNRDSRALPFYVGLTNQIERSEQRGSQRYVSWRYKPGQRLQLRVPVAGFANAIVVPKDAVAQEGPERYVFVENNNLFERVAVHVLASDSMNVAIANDGQVWPGQSIAVVGAHQLQMAMKNKSGDAIDPHAGHNH